MSPRCRFTLLLQLSLPHRPPLCRRLRPPLVPAGRADAHLAEDAHTRADSSTSGHGVKVRTECELQARLKTSCTSSLFIWHMLCKMHAYTLSLNNISSSLKLFWLKTFFFEGIHLELHWSAGGYATFHWTALFTFLFLLSSTFCFLLNQVLICLQVKLVDSFDCKWRFSAKKSHMQNTGRQTHVQLSVCTKCKWWIPYGGGGGVV